MQIEAAVLPPEQPDGGRSRGSGRGRLIARSPSDARETLLVELAYEGTAFAGWAPQPGQRTVAGTLLDAARTLRSDIVEVRGASRTDAGVHARGQIAAFDAAPGIAPRGWVLGLNTRLPPDVSVRRAAVTEPGFVPRFASRGKRYVYTALAGPTREPLLRHSAVHVREPLSVERMREEARAVLGRHDFAAFRSSADRRVDTVRALARVEVLVDPGDPRVVRLVVEGDGFLHNMVRILAGTLLDVGAGRLAEGAFARALGSGRRDELGRTAPAHGLLLDEVFIDWPAGAWP